MMARQDIAPPPPVPTSRRLAPFEGLGQDLRYALRMLRKSPGFTAVALLSLALGIGTNSAIFTVVDALLLKSLPVPDAERLVVVGVQNGRGTLDLFSYSAFRHLSEAKSVCAGLIAVTRQFTAAVRVPRDLAAAAAPGAAGVAPAAVTNAGEVQEAAFGQLVSGNFFAQLGAGAQVGRTFTAAEDGVPGGHPVAVLAYGYWQRRFGRDPGVVGRTLVVNGAPLTIVGVTGPDFQGVYADMTPDFFLPLTTRELIKWRGNTWVDGPTDPVQPVWSQINNHWLTLVARRRPGVSMEQANAVLNTLFQRENQLRAATHTDPLERRTTLDWRTQLEPGARGLSNLRDDLTRPLLVLLGVAGLVLLIACANIANLLLARADRRRKEMAVRLGTGAGRGRLVRQLLTESVLLAGLGSALGVLFAWWGSRLLLSLVTVSRDRTSLDTGVGLRNLAFAAALAVATGIAFGLAPALQGTRVDLASTLKETATALRGDVRRRGRPPLRRVLVVVQIALSLVLLVGAGLFARSLQNLSRVDLGFEPQGLLLANINPRLLALDDARLAALYPRMIERLQALPGVRSASLANFGLLSGYRSISDIALPGFTPRPQDDLDVRRMEVTPGYFATVGMHLWQGRDFAPADRAGAPKVAIVNETAARRFFPRGPALGRRFGFGPAEHNHDYEVVGVVKDARYDHPKEAPPPMVFTAVAQDVVVLRDVEVRAAPGAVAAVAARLRPTLAEIEPNLPVFDVSTMDEQLDRSLSRERAIARLTSFFGLLALLLSAIGLYGVMSYNVAQRTNEIGLRMALGSPPRQVLGLVLRESVVLTLAGVGAGLLAALGLTRLVAGQLFGVATWDPLALAVATLVLAAVAFCAGYLPARRAAATDPMAALRSD